MAIKTLDAFIHKAKIKPIKKIAVVCAEDEPVLQSIKEAYSFGIIEPILVGDSDKIRFIADSIKFDLSKIKIISQSDERKSAATAVSLVRDDEAQILMKGLINTADFLRALLDKEKGLPKTGILSHIAFFETKYYHKLIALTDAAQNIAPTLEDKINIIKNSVDFFHRIGVSKPKIAAIAAVETINTKMEATVHAAILTMMNRRKQIKGCIIDGPLGFDNAVSKEAAKHKGIDSDVAGDTDLILAPNIEVGNVIYKALTYFGGAVVAAVILGSPAPIVLTSRSDSDRSKLMSIALASAF
ncbi:MAG: bifunctional enoyl-CoA hydratase/phosphate acetyltransferase [Candidatus Kapabacteria bacterium]|nr:bifunctional enoyl-CoA hydratase/phosphate acetyltransferase [Candidatus Kapabacteria bacterium]